ncbi:salutaridinol 7-O-acetyltransferase-like [Tripterygium wilfordii]|uniref:salutaridinol 7-O-acetyltransferase-like n=1 Tax=Tripterygium wilfordii TaxID=458696 RepID=UPI0018F7F421|nr:salutaridinol 7-O-acetyltransferase-like [Tripterygium wilfordii]
MELVQVTSQEIIKPSSPTPPHLKYFKISIFDQLFPVFYQPFLFFYHSNPNLSIEEKLGRFKDSLSKTLTRFYPLGGKIKDSTTVDCNDEGVLFVVAKVGYAMIDCLKPLNIELLNMFVPLSPIYKESPEKAVQVGIQINIFSCGGIAIGISFLHKFIDGTTFSAFIKAWAAISRENLYQELCPHSVAASLFPPNHGQFSAQMPFFAEITPRPEQKKVAKWFVFDDTAISSLKVKARSENVHNPTRAEAISGLIWKCLISHDSQEPTTCVHLVNLRPRLSPPLPEYSIGDILWRAIATYDPRNEKNKELSCLVDLLRKSIGEVNADYLSNMQGEEGLEKICKLLEEGREIFARSRKTYAVSSLSKMGLYEADFGWGKPLWVTVAPIVQEVQINMIYQIQTESGDAIEVLAMLDDRDMEKLEHNPEFLAYASLNPDIQA